MQLGAKLLQKPEKVRKTPLNLTASSRSRALSPARRGISLRTGAAGDPSLRLNSGSAQDDALYGGLGIGVKMAGVIPKSPRFLQRVEGSPCARMLPGDPSLRLNSGSAQEDALVWRTGNRRQNGWRHPEEPALSPAGRGTSLRVTESGL